MRSLAARCARRKRHAGGEPAAAFLAQRVSSAHARHFIVDTRAAPGITNRPIADSGRILTALTARRPIMPIFLTSMLVPTAHVGLQTAKSSSR